MTDLTPDAPFLAPTRVAVDEVPLAVIRHIGVRLADIDELYDADFSVLNAAFAAGTLEQAGPPLAVYVGDARDAFDIEVGMPVVAAPDEGDGTISASQMLGGAALVLTHMGSYANLGAPWKALVAAAGDQGTDTWMEVYVTEPGLVRGDQLRTDLYLYITE